MKKCERALKSCSILFVLFLLVFSAGCASDEEKEASHHKKAKQYIENQEFNKAIIELKNIIQLNQKNDVAYYELGETYLKLKQAKKAFQSFSNAIAISPDNLEAQLKIGQVLILFKKTAEARKKAEFIIEKSPENIDALLLLSIIQTQEKNIDAALETLNKCASIDPDNDMIYISQARLYLQNKNIDQAKKAYQKAKSIDTSSPKAYISLARIYGFEKKWDQAEAELKTMIKESGSEYKNLFELARFYESQNKWDQAEKIYLDALDSAPEDDVIPLINLSSYYSRRKLFDKALDTLQKAASIKEDDPTILVGIAQIYLEQEQVKHASDTLDKILEKDNGHVEANFLKGKVHLINKNFDSALPLFDLTVRERPNNALAHYFKALCLLGKGERNLAREDLLKAVELRPDLLPQRLSLAEFYIREKNPESARQQIDTVLNLVKKTAEARKKAGFVIEKSPEKIKALLLLAVIQNQEKDIDAALETLNKCASIDPDNYMIYISQGSLFLRNKNIDQAKKAYQKAKSIDPSSPKAYIALARIYGFEKKWDMAEAELKEMIKESGPEYSNLFELARFYEGQEKWDQAEKIYLDTLDSAPEDDVIPLMNLSSYYSRKKSLDKALDVLQKHASIKKDDLTILVGIAKIYLEKNQIKNASDTLDKIFKKDRDHVEATFLKGRIKLINKDFDKALSLFELTVKERPNFAMAHYFKALCLLGKGESNLAREDLLKAVELKPDLLPPRLILTEFYIQEKNPASARQQIDAVLKVDPNNIKALMFKGNLQVLDKKYNEAETIFLQIIEKAPDYAEAYVKLGVLYALMKKSEKTLEYLEKALNIDPKQLIALTLAVSIHTKSKEYDKAILICEKVKKRTRDNSSLQARIEYLEGNISLSRKDIKTARKYFKQAIASDVNILSAYITLAKLDIRENNIEGAISQYNELIKKDPASLAGHMGLGTIYDQQKEWKKAEASYRKALEIKHDFAPAANNLAWNLLENGGNIDEALGFAQIAKEQMPQAPSVMDTLGWLYYLKGSYLNAISEFKDCLEQEKDNPTINYHLGMTYYKNGQSDNAKQFLEKALTINKDFKEAEDAKRVLKEIADSSASKK